MTRSAVVHIGINKTGTTTIQSALAAMRAQLLSEARVLYPSIARNHSMYLATIFRDRAPKALLRVEPGAADAESAARLRHAYRVSLEEELTRQDWDKLVVSGEGLSHFDRESVRRFREWIARYVDDIRVVAYVRHPVDWTRSAVQQQLKGGSTLEVAHRVRPNLRGRFEPWLKEFGRQRFVLMSFDAACKDGLLHSFLAAADLPSGAAPPEPANQSMSLEAALLLDSLNRQRPLIVNGQVSPERRSYEGRFGIDLLQAIPGNVFRLTPEHAAAVRLDSREDVRWLNATFGVNFFPDIFTDSPTDDADLPATMPSETVDALARLLAELLAAANFPGRDRIRRTQRDGRQVARAPASRRGWDPGDR